MKFLQYIPGATKLFNENKGDIIADMTEPKLVEIFDKVHEIWLRESSMRLKLAYVNALKTSLSIMSSTDSTNDEQSKALYYKNDGKSFKKQSRDPCSICKKNNIT